MREGTYLEKLFGVDGVDVDRPVLDAQGKFVGAAFDGKRRDFKFKDATFAAHLKGLRSFLGADNEVRFESISRSGTAGSSTSMARNSRAYTMFTTSLRGKPTTSIPSIPASPPNSSGASRSSITPPATEIASQDRIAIAGWSYGGYAALMGPVRDPGLYQCAAAINGVADLDAMMDYDKAYFGRQSEAYEAMLAMIGHPKKDAARIKARSPINHIESFDIPVLIIAGDKDKRVSPEQAQAMADALKAAGKDVRHVVYPGADHSLEGKMPGEDAPSEDAADDATYDAADDTYDYKAALRELEAFLPRCFAG